MRIINVTDGMTSILLGRMGENEATQVVWDVSDWLEEYPGAAIALINQVPNSNEEYPVVISAPEDGKVKWTVGGAELLVEGYGNCTLEAVVGNTVAKKHIWRTRILPGMGQPGEAPDPWDSWITEFARMTGEAQDAEEDAEEAAEDAEAWAVGKRGGQDVGNTDPTYENNAKYYAELAGEAVEEALEDMDFSAVTLDPGSDATVTKEVDPETGEISIIYGIPRGMPGNEIQIHEFTFTVPANAAEMDVNWSRTRAWFAPGLPVFTDNARVIGMDAADTLHWKNLNYSIQARSVTVYVTIMPGAAQQTLKLYIAETKPKA